MASESMRYHEDDELYAEKVAAHRTLAVAKLRADNLRNDGSSGAGERRDRRRFVPFSSCECSGSHANRYNGWEQSQRRMVAQPMESASAVASHKVMPGSATDRCTNADAQKPNNCTEFILKFEKVMPS